MDHRRKNKLYLVVSILFLLSLSSCGSNESQETAYLTSNSFSYRARDNGCDTGFHRFNSLSEMCSGLQNRVLNNHCAEAARRQFFIDSKCPGSFVPFN